MAVTNIAKNLFKFICSSAITPKVHPNFNKHNKYFLKINTKQLKKHNMYNVSQT